MQQVCQMRGGEHLVAATFSFELFCQFFVVHRQKTFKVTFYRVRERERKRETQTERYIQIEGEGERERECNYHSISY